MTQFTAISSNDALYAINNGDFPQHVIKASERVAVIMTQDWCSQWQAMSQWLRELTLPDEASVFVYIYNLDVHFRSFLALKEGTWKNSLIPYIRFYKNGQLVAETNYLSKEEFIRMLTA